MNQFYTFPVDEAYNKAASLSKFCKILPGIIGFFLFLQFYFEVCSHVVNLKLLLEIDGQIVQLIAENIGFAIKILLEDGCPVLYVKSSQTDDFQRVIGNLTSNRLLIETHAVTNINLRRIGWNGILHSFDAYDAIPWIGELYNSLLYGYLAKFNKLKMAVLSGNSEIFPGQHLIWTGNWEAYFEGRYLDRTQISEDIVKISEYLLELTEKIKRATNLQEASSVQVQMDHPLTIFCRENSLPAPTSYEIERFLVNFERFSRNNERLIRKSGTCKIYPSFFMNEELREAIKEYERLHATVLETDDIDLLRGHEKNVQKFLRAARSVSMFEGNSQGMRFDNELMERFMCIVEGVSAIEEDEGCKDFVKAAGGGVVSP